MRGLVLGENSTATDPELLNGYAVGIPHDEARVFAAPLDRGCRSRSIRVKD